MSILNTLIPSLNRTPATAENCTGATCVAGLTLKPRYEVRETAEAYHVTVQLPGVAKDGLEITAEAGQVRIAGRRAWAQPDGWTVLHRETADAAYELVLTHDEAIDAGKIAAELRDGVLQVTLAKPAAVQPRKIAVN